MKRIIGISFLALVGFWFTGCDTNSDASVTSGVSTKSTPNIEVQNDNTEDVTVIEADQQEEETTTLKKRDGKVEYLSTKDFLSKIWDFNSNPKQWVYKSDKPTIIDFYAEWCGPCKKVAPIMDELAAEYTGKVNFYKIDTDKEQQLAGQVFGIRSIPSILYIPVNGQPQMFSGLMAKETYVNKINELLLK